MCPVIMSEIHTPLSSSICPTGIMYSFEAFPLHCLLSDKAKYYGRLPPGLTGHDSLHSSHAHKQTAAETKTTLRPGSHCGPPWLRVGVVRGGVKCLGGDGCKTYHHNLMGWVW